MDDFDLSDIPLEVLMQEIKDRSDSAVLCVKISDDTEESGYSYQITFRGDPLVCMGLASKAQILISQEEDDFLDDECSLPFPSNNQEQPWQ